MSSMQQVLSSIQTLGASSFAPRSCRKYMSCCQWIFQCRTQLDSGKRGGRLDGIQQRVCRLTGAEDCIVVNNNAAATLLAVSAIAGGKELLFHEESWLRSEGHFGYQKSFHKVVPKWLMLVVPTRPKPQIFVSS